MTKAAVITARGLTATQALQKQVDEEIVMREIFTKFITAHMKAGTDYGKIANFPKNCLFKPGAEKIGSLLRLRPDVVKDSDTWEMAGSKPGLFCYKCILYNANDKEVGMGLGACDVTEKKNVNNAIKIAKKRAFVDAILATGALSDFFTQDLEDSVDAPLTPPVAPQALPAAFIGMIDKCNTKDALLAYCVPLKKKLDPKLINSLNREYTRRLKELEAIELSKPDTLVDEVDAALNPKFNSK